MIKLVPWLLLLLPQDADERWKAISSLADRHREIKTLTASYVQERRSALLKEPLISKGTLSYRGRPARLVFSVTEPRKTLIHLDASSYQVYRPDEKQLEKFEFETNELATALLQSISPNVESLKKDFGLKSCEEKEGVATIELSPKRPKIKEFLSSLRLSIRKEGAVLTSIVYLDAEGDEVRINLTDLVLDPKLPEDTFTLNVPKETRVLVHRVNK